MTKVLRVGIIGVNADSGWARDSHVPAVQGLKGLELSAVAARSREMADAAAAAFGVPKAYGGGLALIADPDIDILTVATRVPDHKDLVLAALAAGKHVYSEWPLGRGVAESGVIAPAARRAGVDTAIGLQLRAAPAVHRARELLAAGGIGRVLSVHVISASAGFGAAVPDPFLYLEDPANFANMVTITGGHTIDLVIAIFGALTVASVLASRQYHVIRAGQPREERVRTAFAHLLLHGHLGSATPLSAEVVGGRPPETPFRLEAVGETGSLQLGGGARRGGAVRRSHAVTERRAASARTGELSGLPESAVNVAGVYARLRDDVRNGTFRTKGFDHAVDLTRFMEDILVSSDRGTRAIASEWPVD